MTVLRHSSRRDKLDVSLLNARLTSAVSYDRIAGYFRSSLLEVAGEAIENVVGKVRVVCNSDLEPADVETAKAAQQAMRQSWCASAPEKLATTDAGRGRFARLFDLLASGKLVGEGFDHPPLDTMVLAMPVSWKGTLQQYAGRLHREHASKTDVRIIDFVDTGHPTLLRIWDKRQRGYRAMGYRMAAELEQLAPNLS